jgi:hypothetical protein
VNQNENCLYYIISYYSNINYQFGTSNAILEFKEIFESGKRIIRKVLEKPM